LPNKQNPAGDSTDMRAYDAYLFDWDGTLARTVEIWVGIIVAHLADYGVMVTEHQVSLLYGDYTSPVKLGLLPELNDQFHRELVPLAMEKLSHAALYDGAVQMVRSLKKDGKKLALISSSRQENIIPVLDSYNIGAVFDAFVTQADTKTHKPNPECMLLALERLGITNRRAALVLGDTVNDIQAATNAGLDSLLFCPPSHQMLYDIPALQALHPTYMIQSWRELIPERFTA